ncbi:hypothetical protein K443DRAFT_14192 [Laccaria amethystina LaAM-08-1]|uniref:Uncharacterized protein n=1 Tax=Laccaria amethystina LaAM-08-1 TaxID=1095629 RepID=A0A0C9WN69_9AGAR|nr:hypothetical protein K443DRAFT_14192 [Laccaria amethystina LaAM-08-1]
MSAILHCLGLHECLEAFSVSLVYLIYSFIIYVVAPFFLMRLPQPWRTPLALLWTFCQPLCSVGVCLLFPFRGSVTGTTTVVEATMFISYLGSIIFAYRSMGLTGFFPIIGAAFFAVIVYVTCVDPSFRAILRRHGQSRFLAQRSALERLMFLSVAFELIWGRFIAWLRKDGEQAADGNAQDVVSLPLGEAVHEIPPPYSCQQLPVPYDKV